MVTGQPESEPLVSCLITRRQSLYDELTCAHRVGDKRHVMSYSISAGKSFNMVLSHPDDSDPDTWNQQSALDDMRIHFKGWDPRLENLIKKIRTTLKWPLLSGSVLDRWVHPKGKLVILGDAAHAMLPYMSQGNDDRYLRLRR